VPQWPSIAHRDHNDDDGCGQANREDAESHLAVLLVARHPTRPRPVGRTTSKLLAAATLQGCLLFEGNLELGNALSHSHE